eukprot:scaffold15812_cov91-Skeletonema_dohrnii-CCMP3373.AAC.1
MIPLLAMVRKKYVAMSILPPYPWLYTNRGRSSPSSELVLSIGPSATQPLEALAKCANKNDKPSASNLTKRAIPLDVCKPSVQYGAITALLSLNASEVVG